MDIEKSVLFDRNIEMTVGDRTFAVKPISLKDIVSGEFQESKLFIPQDKNNIGHLQFYNISTPESREQVDKWMKRTLFHNDEPVSFEQAVEWDFDITDIGRWLDLVVRASG